MLALTKKTGYALIAMSHLARLRADELASAREIADQYGVPVSLLMNVLKELAAAGFVESVRGAHGGYRLLSDPAAISLADIITSLEGPIRLAECMLKDSHDIQGDNATCRILDRCPIADPVHRVQRKLSEFIRSVMLADIAEPANAAKI